MFPSVDRLILWLPAFVVAIAVHEASHALAASLLGDSTPRRQGRLTLNPLRHLDPLGTITLIYAGFGWGKPVFVDPGQFRIHPITGNAIVAVAGPLSNVVLAIVFGLPDRFHLEPTQSALLSAPMIGSINLLALTVALVKTTAAVNLLLAVFNLIPLPPLDGFSVLMGVLPRSYAIAIAPLAKYGPPALLMLFALSYFGIMDVFGRVIMPPFNALYPIVIGG